MRGSIETRQRSGGIVYRARISVLRDGDRVWVSQTFRRKRDAEAWLADRIAEENTGGTVVPSALTVGDAVRRWLAVEAPSQVRPGTLEDYERTLRVHVLPHWEQVRLSDLSSSAVQQWQQRLAAKSGSRTVAAAHDRFRQVLDAAVRWGDLRVNPVRSVKRPRITTTVPEPWTAAEARLFLTATAASPWHSLWAVALATGLRLGELLGLAWEQVDLERGALEVVQQVQIVGNRVEVVAPKTKAARRTVRLSPEVVRVLAEVERTGPWVWSAAGGVPTRPTTVHRAWDRAIERSGVRRIRIHDMRHTHATLLLAAGVSVPVVAQRLGHANPSITLSTYAHALPDGQESAAAWVEEHLF